MPDLPPAVVRFRADTSHFRSVVAIIAHHFQAFADDLAGNEEDPMLLPGAREIDPQSEADRLGATRLLGEPDAHFCRCGGKCPCSDGDAEDEPPHETVRSLGMPLLPDWADNWDAETVVRDGLNPVTRSVVKIRPPAKVPTAAAFAGLEKRFLAYCGAAWDLGRVDPEEVVLMGGKSPYLRLDEPTDAWPGSM